MDLEIKLGEEELPKIEESNIHVAAMTGSNVRAKEDRDEGRSQTS